jgi:hypothetical protein
MNVTGSSFASHFRWLLTAIPSRLRWSMKWMSSITPTREEHRRTQSSA